MNRFNALYFPADGDEQILMLNDRRPYQATVMSLDGNKADLVVIDHFGNRFVRTSVPFSRRNSSCDLCIMA